MGSAELKFEIVLLREAECADLSTMRPAHVRCGRAPHFARPGSQRCRANLRRVSACHDPAKIGERARRLGVARHDCNDKGVQLRAARLYEKASRALSRDGEAGPSDSVQPFW